MSQRHTSRGTAFVLAFLLLGPPSAAAQNLDLRRDQAAEITADRIVYESKRRVYVAQGSVRIVQGERRIDADWLVFNRTTQRGIAATVDELMRLGEELHVANAAAASFQIIARPEALPLRIMVADPAGDRPPGRYQCRGTTSSG